jgi:pilus assembly protein CpaF
MSLEMVMPFLQPIAHLIRDASISEVMVNGSGRIFFERDGHMQEETEVTIREEHLRVAVQNAARVLGEDISEERPILDARLSDGSRLAAVLFPVSLVGTTLTIRKFQSQRFTTDELVRIGTLTADQHQVLRQAIHARVNILISGGTGTGKTTLLNALVTLMPPEHRLALIEDTAELQLDAKNLFQFEARREQTGLPAVTMRDLLRASLRHRPDRILVGEVRGGEAFDLLQALNTGHAGSLSTIHANGADQALRRFAWCAAQSDVKLPYPVIRQGLAECLQVVMHLERRREHRVVTELVRVRRYLHETDTYELESLCPEPDGSTGDGEGAALQRESPNTPPPAGCCGAPVVPLEEPLCLPSLTADCSAGSSPGP